MFRFLDTALFKQHIEEDETIKLIVHKHWVLGLKSLFWPTAAFIACWVVLYAVPFLTMFYIVAGLSVLTLVWWMRNFFDYYLDAWVITDHGIVDVEWFGTFHRESTRILYSDIQGVSYEINGVLGTCLRYGTLSVEKISTGSTISMDHVARPRKIESLILTCMEEYLHSKNMQNSKHVQELLAEMLAQELQLREVKGRVSK